MMRRRYPPFDSLLFRVLQVGLRVAMSKMQLCRLSMRQTMR